MKPGSLFTPSVCEICKRNQATVFMVVHDNRHSAKAHVCMNCFEGLQAIVTAKVESVSLQDFEEAEDTEPAIQTPNG